METRRREIWIAISVLLFYFSYVFGILHAIPLILFRIDINKMSSLVKILYLLSIEILFIIAVFMIYKKDMLTDWKDFKEKWLTYLGEYIKYWFILLLLMYASNFIIVIIQRLCHHKEDIAQNEQLVREILKKFPIYMVISSIITGPLEEEMIFRKVPRKLFSNKWIYIIISGLFFGAMHVLLSMTSAFDLLYIISYSIPGFIFAYVYYKSKNIFVSVSLHTIHNTVLIFLQLLVTLL